MAHSSPKSARGKTSASLGKAAPTAKTMQLSVIPIRCSFAMCSSFRIWHVFGHHIIPLEALAAVLENKKSPRDDHVPQQEIKAHLFFRLATKALKFKSTGFAG